MQSLVHIAFNTIQSFNLSDADKEVLISMLQGDEKQITEKQARKKLKPPTKEQIQEKEMTNWLKKNHFKSQNNKKFY